MKDEVKQITVIERDPQIPIVLQKFSNFDQWKGKEKIKLIEEDARLFESSEHFDFLYADFWKHMADSRMSNYMRQIRKNVPNVKLYGYWTQEFDYIEHLRRHELPVRMSNPYHYEWWVREMDMPLVGQNSEIFHWYAVLAPTVQMMANAYVKKEIMRGERIKEIAYEIIEKIENEVKLGKAIL